MRLSLDRGGRTTRDYEGPQVAPRVQAALDAAMHNVEPDIEVDVSALNAKVGQAPVRGFRKHSNGHQGKKNSKNCWKDNSGGGGSGGSSSQVGEAYPSSRGLVPKWDRLASAKNGAVIFALNLISFIALVVILFDLLH
jgi:kinesin family protein 3/17